MELQNYLRRTKIVATVGPAITKPDILREIIKAGATTLRLNFSHGTHQNHQNSIRLIRQTSFELNNSLVYFGSQQMRVISKPKKI